MNHGQNVDSERVVNETQIEEPTGAPDSTEKLHALIEKQSNQMILLTGKLIEMTTKLEALESHQDQSDAAIIEVAKKVGTGGGGGKGGGGALERILPLLMQPRGPGPLEKIAMNMFLRNMAFTSLTTERLAKKQFGDEYSRMVKDMEAEMAGAGNETKPAGT